VAKGILVSPGRARLHSDILWCGVLAVALGLLIWNRWTFDAWIARHDNLTAYLPWWSYLGERLSAGEIPGWNPHQFSGIPFLGDPQSGWMHAPTMIAFTLFEPIVAMKMKLLIELAIAAFSAYALARLFGYRPIAAFAGASVLAFGPLSVQVAYCCTVRLHVATWMPLALLGCELAFRLHGWRGRLTGILIAAFAYSQILAGWLGQGSLDAALILGAYCLYRSVTLRRDADAPRRGRLAVRAVTAIPVAAAVGLTGAAMNAAALLPRLAINPETNLGAGDYEELTGGYFYRPFSFSQLVSTIVDDDFRHRGFTIPAAGIVLILLAVVLVPRAHPVPFFAGMTLVVCWLTLDAGPPYWLLSLVPKWEELHDHYPQQVSAGLMIGPAILAAAGMDALSRLRRHAKSAPRVLAAGAVLVVGCGWLAATGDNVRTLILPLIVVSIAGLVILLFIRFQIGRHAATAMLALLAVLVFIHPTGLELFDAESGTRLMQGWGEHWEPEPGLATAAETHTSVDDPGGAGDFLRQQMAEDGPFRYAGYAGSGYPGDPLGRRTLMQRRAGDEIKAILVNGRAIFLDLYDMQGYNPTQLGRYVDYFTAMNGAKQDYHLAELRHGGADSPLINLLNVRYILIDPRIPTDRSDIAGLTHDRPLVFENEHVRVYENLEAQPHAWLAHDLRHVTRAQAMALLQERAVDFRQVALVENGDPMVSQPPNGAIETVTITDYRPERIRLDVGAAADGLLVLSEIYSSGWRATVDGEPAEIHPTNLALRGIPVPAGAHRVELTYEAPWLGVGLVVSVIAHLALVTAVSWLMWTRRPQCATRESGSLPS